MWICLNLNDNISWKINSAPKFDTTPFLEPSKMSTWINFTGLVIFFYLRKFIQWKKNLKSGNSYCFTCAVATHHWAERIPRSQKRRRKTCLQKQWIEQRSDLIRSERTSLVSFRYLHSPITGASKYNNSCLLRKRERREPSQRSQL